MGPTVTAKTDPKPAARPLPTDAANVALVAADTCAAIGAMSVSWWHAAVAAKRAPQPAFRAPRCTRWRLADVTEFWRDFASQDDTQAGAELKARASKASAAAQVKRCKPAAVLTQVGA